MEETQGSGEWVANDMTVKLSNTGARVATLNTERKLYADERNWEIVAALMKKLGIDILVLTEPGKADAKRMADLQTWAILSGMTANTVNRSNSSLAGGMVILTGTAWAGVATKTHVFTSTVTDKDRAFAVEYDNRQQGEHNKLLVIGYYGLNASNTQQKEVKALHSWVWRIRRQFKQANWQAPVILVGDMNAAQTTMYDTDRLQQSEEMPGEDMEMEADAGTINHLEDLGFSDAIRLTHPTTRITTRRPPKKGVRREGMRHSGI